MYRPFVKDLGFLEKHDCQRTQFESEQNFANSCDQFPMGNFLSIRNFRALYLMIA